MTNTSDCSIVVTIEPEGLNKVNSIAFMDNVADNSTQEMDPSVIKSSAWALPLYQNNAVRYSAMTQV